MKNKFILFSGMSVLMIVSLFVILSNLYVKQWALSDQREEQAFSVIQGLDRLQLALLEANRDRRDFLSTGNDEFRKSYYTARDNVRLQMESVAALAADKPWLQKDWEAISRLVGDKLARNDSIMARATGKNLEAVDTGRHSMNEIRRQINVTKEDTVKILRGSSADQSGEIRKIQYLVLLNSLILLGLTGFSLVLLKRDAALRQKSEENLIRQQGYLEDQVRERTRELIETNARLQSEISERSRVERLVQEANHRLQTHEKMIQEQERLALSREVHDEIGQSLTALKLDLSWIERRLPPGSGELVDRLTDIRGNLGRLIDTTRQITSRLRPPLLDNLGLAAAIEWQVNDFSRRSGLKCHVMLNEGVETDDEQISTSLLRILQESLANIARHAGAAEVGVSLCRQGDAVVLEVSDNGSGITQENIAAPTSYGIMGMRERAHLCGGSLSISGGPGEGTIVRCTVPVPAGKVET